MRQLQHPRQAVFLLSALSASKSDAVKMEAAPPRSYKNHPGTISTGNDARFSFLLRSPRAPRSVPTSPYSPTSAATVMEQPKRSPPATPAPTRRGPAKGTPRLRPRTAAARPVGCPVTRGLSVTGCRGQRTAGPRSPRSGPRGQEGLFRHGGGRGIRILHHRRR